MRTILLVALALVAPLATAAPSITTTSDPAQDAFACTARYVFIDAHPAPCGPIGTLDSDGSGVYYLVGGPTGVYQETNGCPGFQHEPGLCAADGLYHGRDPWVGGH